MCNSVINAFIIQYIIVLNIIQEIYATINDSLIDIFKKSKNMALIQNVRSNYVQDNLERLSKLQQLYILLNKICNDVSKFYFLPILLCTFDTFLLLILGGYYLAKSMVLGKNDLTTLTYMHTIFYLQLFAVSLIMLTISVTNTINEVIFRTIIYIIILS